MSQTITIFAEGSKEYERLEAAAHMIEAELNLHCKVNNVLFDAGQNWAWTTISMESGMASFPYCQILDPRQHALLVEGNIDEWFETVKQIIKDHQKK